MEHKPWLIKFIEESGWLNKTKEKNLMYLIEEVGEFAREIRRHEEGRGEHPEEVMSKEEMRAKLLEEAGDVLAAFYTILLQYDIKTFDEPLQHFKDKIEKPNKEVKDNLFIINSDGTVTLDQNNPHHMKIKERIESWFD